MSDWMCLLHNVSLGGQSVRYANTHPICPYYDPTPGAATNPFVNKYLMKCRSCQYCAMEQSGRAMEYSKQNPEWIPGIIKGKTIPEINPKKEQKPVPKDRFAMIDMR